MASDITPEAIGFLSAVGVFVVVLAVLFLFINKKLCFSRVGGLPCLELHGRRKRTRDKPSIHQGLVMSSPVEAQTSASAFSLWLSQVSQALSTAFSGPAKPGPTVAPEAPAESVEDGSDPTLQSGRSSTADEAGLDVSSSDPQESLKAIRAQLAEMGTADEQTTEDMSTVLEENDDLESELLRLQDSDVSSVTSLCSVTTYGRSQDRSSSSDSEDEIVKQFEISASRSQSFRMGVAEGGQQPAEGRHKFTRLLSDQEEGSTEPSDCEDADAPSRQSNQDPLTQAEDERGSMGSRNTADRPKSNRREGVVVREGSPARSLDRQATEGSPVMETAMDNLAYEDNEGTDSSPTWSPEEQANRDPLSQAPLSHHPISKCGSLIIILDYKMEAQKLLVTVVTARDIPDKERSGMDTWQVHVVLLPTKKQRHKTAIQRGSAPHFGETFRFSRLDPTELSAHALRFRLYAMGKATRDHMMGERLFPLSGLKQPGEMEITLMLEPRSNMKTADSQLSLSVASQSDSASPAQALSHGGTPELLVGLSYSATTGRLSVELIKGSHFRNLAVNRPPDTYGKMTLLNSMGQEISRCKTSLRRGQPNPVYKETFVFQVALFQLCDVTLMISIYSRRNMKRKEMVGWVSLGQNSSGEEEQLHWQDMKESHGQQVCRWHVLLES